MSKARDNQVIMIGLAAAAAASLLYYFAFAQTSAKEEVQKKTKRLDDDDDRDMIQPSSSKDRSISSVNSLGTEKASNISAATAARAEEKNRELEKLDDKTLHAKIEEMDKKGKALFKNKQVRDARRREKKTKVLSRFLWLL